MKNLTQYLNESDSSGWLQGKIDELTNCNTNGELKSITILYGIKLEDWYRCEVWDGYGRLWDEETAKTHINTAYINSSIIIDVVTTDKGNFYGVTRSAVNDRPNLAKLFNKRVKGVKGHVWTNKIENIKSYLEFVTKNKKIDQNASGYDIFNMYYSSKDLAKSAADKLSKYHNIRVTTTWHNEKIKELQNKVKQRQEKIESCKEEIARLEQEIQDIKADITEYETLKNVSSEDFNESLIENV